ncbi:biosynthetic-type acetolactate synthase large subunit [Desulfomicrobium orale]|uniref:Acetolactate synthase n=1 Tax=Desulfomicrobium orale DSM 12838 TaxID=888061 RepID=A0A0X8JRM9_9BACT|nr:biosynthetic-type acetolactate synthase large subunit [Desulfomicrobium orale]AMD93630.1 acetolactate synthase catalytic subunit [Desulfomicrobium orale DSM 12838]
MMLTGARILMECLKREGVDLIFGFPGGAVIDVYDELPNHPFRHILVRHEQAAVHAADGYARASGKVGVCLVTSGPGATNTVTGIATAYMDSIPLVVITGQVPTHLIGNDAFQEADIVGITRSCTKHNYLVKNVAELAATIKQAFYIARTGRPGPVLIDLPKNVITASTEFSYPETIHIRSYNPNYSPNRKQLRKAAELIAQAERPAIYAGGGVISSDSAAELVRLAELCQCPVTTTLMGLGAFPGDHPLWLGMLGMHGTYTANMAVNSCDVLISVGARFDDRVTGRVSAFAAGARIIHIDIDPTSISKNVVVHVPVVADCKLGLQGLIEEADRISGVDWAAKHEKWNAALAEMRAVHPLGYGKTGERIKPQQVVEKIFEISRGEAIITTEVGQNQMWAAQFYTYRKPRTLLTSGGLGTMGYGFPAAIGAQLAFPDRLVVDVAGDGSIQMNIQELATAVSYQVPVKIVILNNGYLGMVRQWQELFYKKNYCSTCLHANPDFVALARAYGAEGFLVEKSEELESTLRAAFAHPGPVVVDVRVEPEENVAPMVPAGAALAEMLLV